MMGRNSAILAFDVALGACSVGVASADGVMLAERSRPMARGQSEVLVPMIAETLESAGLAFADIARIVTTVGPGGFTGVRIGLSTARALGLALGVRVDGVLTTEVLSRDALSKNQIEHDDLMVVLDTKRGDFYAHHFLLQNSGATYCNIMTSEQIFDVFSARPLTLCGDGVGGLCAAAGGRGIPGGWTLWDTPTVPSPAVMVAMARDGVGLHQPAPVYLRGAETSVSTRPTRHLAEDVN